MKRLRWLFLFLCIVFTNISIQGKDLFKNVKKILVIGNSLSHHVPRSDIGWNGNWGMAASSKDKDYVHVLLKELDKRYPHNTHSAEIFRLKDEANMTGYDYLLTKKADMVIVQVGENYRNTPELLMVRYEKMLRDIKANITPNIICIGSWALESKSTRRNRLEICAEKLNIPFANINDLAKLPNSAYYDKRFNKGKDALRWHPSDKGMQKIAQRCLDLLGIDEKPSVSATIKLDFNDVIGPVNHNVMGQMIIGGDGQYIWGHDTPDMKFRKTGWGVWDAKNKVPNPVVTKLFKALRPGVIRYPGGSVAKNYNWKLLVGPLDKRQAGWHWGLIEYINFCRAVNAEPQICLSEYVGTPEDQRELVEFLNSPATSNHPWAMKRAQFGYREPFNVKYFELGNEPYDGNRRVIPRKQWDVKGYCQWANKTIKLIRSVCPDVKLGVPNWITREGTNEILRRVGINADFYVVHTYSVAYSGNQPLDKEQEDRVMRACMAVGDQFEARLKRDVFDTENAGKKLMLGVTEYNALFMNGKPRPYRMSMGAGLFCIDYVFRMLKPENNVLLANYWSMFHGYWGPIRGEGIKTIHPPYYCYKITAQHLGDEIIRSEVDAPKIEFEGFCEVKPCKGSKLKKQKIIDLNLYNKNQIFISKKGKQFKSYFIKPVGNEIHFFLNGTQKENYPSFATVQNLAIPEEFRVDKNVAYELSFEGCWLPKPGSGDLNLGLGIMDSRGWKKAGSAIGVQGVKSKQWKKYKGIYTPLKDTPSMIILGRILAGNQKVSGTFKARNISLKPVIPNTFPAYSSLSVLASKANGKIYLLIINKYTDRKVNAKIKVAGKALKAASVKSLTTPEAASVSGAKISKPSKVEVKDNVMEVTLNPHSITALEIQ